jgi:hypothetical protein
MRTIYQSSYDKSHADVFEAKISEIKFGPIDPNFKYDDWTKHIINMFDKIELEEGDLCIKESSTNASPPSRIFRIKKPECLFWYVDVIPATRQFLFIKDKAHTQCLSPEEGIANLTREISKIVFGQ